MIRPVIEAIYDYRMVYAQETNPNARSQYKQAYIQACGLVGAEDIMGRLDGGNLEAVIGEWNSKHIQLNAQKEQGRIDYKSKLDEMFKNNGKNWYKNRDYIRSISRQKSEQVRELVRSQSDVHSGYSKNRQYANYSYQRYHNNRNDYGNQKYRDRY